MEKAKETEKSKLTVTMTWLTIGFLIGVGTVVAIVALAIYFGK